MKASFCSFLILSAVMLAPAPPAPAGELDASTGETAADELPSKPAPAVTPERIADGKKIYDFRCAPCHGSTGMGDGPAAMSLDPRPRDFSRGIFKFKTTPQGEPVSDQDLYRTISRGLPGTAMPAWKRVLSEDERWLVIAYIKTFSDRFKTAAPAQPIPVGDPPSRTAEAIEKGNEIFHKKAQPPCALCHGENGRGNGPLAPAVLNAWGEPLFPRNLTQPWTYKSGHAARDIFLRDSAGIEGTPMPGYQALLTEEERWQLAYYVESLQTAVEPAAKVTIQSRRISEEIPMDPASPVWKDLDRVDVRMTGQVHVAPRNQNPTVTIVSVRSVYNDKEVAFLLQWDDRIKNMTHENNAQTAKWETADFSETYTVLYPPTVRLRNLRDGAALQFPVRVPAGPAKPHFFLGDVGNPVNLWHWKADTETVEEINATGYSTPAKIQPAASQQTQSQAVFNDGQWSLVLKRPLTTEDAANDIQFEPGRMIPVAVNVWDGFNGETGLRRTISSWYFLVLEAPVSPKVYIMTVLAIGLTAGLELFFIRRVRRKSN